MNLSANEVMTRCKRCGTACAPWLSLCRSCGEPMAGAEGVPEWGDGQANSALLSSLDAIGGKGDMADQEMFSMLDEIEHLVDVKVKAGQLLNGSGTSMPGGVSQVNLAEIEEIDSAKNDLPTAFKTTQEKSNLGESFPESASTIASTPEFLRAQPTQPTLPKLASVEPALTIPVVPGTLLSNVAQRRDAKPAQAQAAVFESNEIAAPEREMELVKKRKPSPEEFLPPDFFDPRDRKPKSQWGWKISLGLVFFVLICTAIGLMYKTYQDSKGPQRIQYDLSKPPPNLPGSGR